MLNAREKESYIRILSRIMVPIVCICLLGLLVYANSHGNMSKIADTRRAVLEGSWKVIKGDQPEYRNSSYDDSAWQAAKVPSNIQRQLSMQPGDFVWYRKWVYLPPRKSSFNLGMELGKIAYYDEVFVNGHIVGASGSNDTNNMFIEKVRIYQIPNAVLHFGEYNLIAIRVSGGEAGVAGIIEGKLVFGDYAQLLAELVRSEAAVLIFSGSFLILGFCVLFFFIRRPKEREYLFFGLGSLDMAVYTFYVSQWRYILDIEKSCDFRLYYLSVFFVVPLFMRFTYELLPKSNPHRKIEEIFNCFTKGLLLFGGVCSIGLLLYNDVRAFEYVDAYINNWVIICSSCIGTLYVLYKLTVSRDNDAIMMFGGCTIAFCGGVLETARQYYPNLPPYIATWGLAIFIFSQTIVLTNRFLRLHEKVEQYSKNLEKMVDTRTEQLKIMEESRRRLLANISHDLRTPVTSVLGHVELLLEEIAESPDQQRTYLKRIHSKMIGLHRLIQDLFELAKIESNQAKFLMAEISAKELLVDIYLKYVSDVENAGVRLEYKSTVCPEVLINADFERLDQVFANLISNSVRYMDGGGVITLSCEMLENSEGTTDGRREVLFKIVDDGVGIAPEHVPYIFERFYRGSQAREMVSNNSGLGLAISKEIVEAHGGKIWVDIQADSGCTICFSIAEKR